MSICLSNLSADIVLEHIAQSKLEIGPASPDPSSFVADPAAVESVLGDFADKLPRPIDVVVNDAGRRRHAADVACHVWNGSLPRNSVFALSEGLYVSSPEFTLAQQSSQLHQAVLCQLLGRYLGTWSPKEGAPKGQCARAPLTSFEDIKAFLAEAGWFRGKDNLKLAMAYTCEGAASEPETSFQLALCLPPELCGLNLEQPIMSWRDKRFGMEYQGEGHGMQLGADYARWFAAREEGYELWFVAKEQLASAEQMLHIASEVAVRLGSDVDTAAWPKVDELQGLLDILGGREHPKPLTNAELRGRRASVRKKRRGIGGNASSHLQNVAKEPWIRIEGLAESVDLSKGVTPIDMPSGISIGVTPFDRSLRSSIYMACGRPLNAFA